MVREYELIMTMAQATKSNNLMNDLVSGKVEWESIGSFERTMLFRYVQIGSNAEHTKAKRALARLRKAD